jgi:hypothetical protein
MDVPGHVGQQQQLDFCLGFLIYWITAIATTLRIFADCDITGF